MPSGHYATVNGLKMYYETHGAGEPLLLLHGGATSAEAFVNQVPYFAKEFYVIVPEQMGHGRTADAVDRAFHYHDMAEDTVELMRQLKIESALVVGWSDGGILGVDLAIHHPDRVRKLACAGTNFRVDGMEEEAVTWLSTVNPDEWPRVYRETYERLSPDGPSHWPIVLRRIVKMFLSEPNYTREEMATIRAPTLVIVGDHDMVKPEHALEMFRLIPGAQLCVIPHAGHGVPVTQPQLWNDIVLSFLKAPPAAS